MVLAWVAGLSAVALAGPAPSAMGGKPVLGGKLPPVCGERLTRNVSLTADLVCTGDGLVIGTDNVTIELNGHSIIGDGDPGDVGIRNPGYKRMNVRNSPYLRHARIRGFGTGIRMSRSDGGSPNGYVTGVEIFSNQVGVSENSGYVVLNDTDIHDNVGNGVDLLGGDATWGAQNAVHRNGGDGVHVDGGELFSGKDTGVPNLDVYDNGGSGIGGQLGCLGSADLTAVRATGNVGNGIGLDQAPGGCVGGLLQLTGVVVSGNGSNGLVSNGRSVRLSDIRAVSNAIDGINIGDYPDQWSYIGNVYASSNGDDGLQVGINKPGTMQISYVTANWNVDLGIDARPGVIDKGANFAKGNGNPLQCVNVHCG